MKAGKLTPRARKDIAQAINSMQAARDLWTDASRLGLPPEQVKAREQAFNAARLALNALLDRHTEVAPISPRGGGSYGRRDGTR